MPEMQKMSFSQKIINFWFYHKYKVLVGTLLIIALIVSVQSCINKEKSDITVLYATKAGMTMDQQNQLKSKIAEFVDDVNGDGVVTVQLIFYPVNQITTTPTNVTPSMSKGGTAYDMIQVQVFMGKPFIYLFDKDLFEFIKKSGALSDLNQVFGPILTEGGNDEMLYFDLANKGFFSRKEPDLLKGYDIKMGFRVYAGTPRENNPDFQKEFEVSFNAVKNILKSFKTQ